MHDLDGRFIPCGAGRNRKAAGYIVVGNYRAIALIFDRHQQSAIRQHMLAIATGRRIHNRLVRSQPHQTFDGEVGSGQADLEIVVVLEGEGLKHGIVTDLQRRKLFVGIRGLVGACGVINDGLHRLDHILARHLGQIGENEFAIRIEAHPVVGQIQSAGGGDIRIWSEGDAILEQRRCYLLAELE